MSESSTVRKTIGTKLQLAGWHVLQLEVSSASGIPDTVAFIEGITYWIECKKTTQTSSTGTPVGGMLRPSQARTLDSMSKILVPAGVAIQTPNKEIIIVRASAALEFNNLTLAQLRGIAVANLSPSSDPREFAQAVEALADV